ncbi:hypothetical protein [Methanosarcina acetivorans]|nr:hypothetical protein [Methanosarcina acetivorans]
MLLAGMVLSLPNMIVTNRIMKPKCAALYISLVVLIATFSGLIYGSLVT